ncbi:hypothetical protein CTI12_AA122290 [Artemisia annua]|uniref:Uncharacterized protein n=1 Tax=Artemisia annua TaxID=35608 RepID=A0A2U1PR63_ARTAN|nr:hypothetical protein CTI12_AA122290 [Artemisia annua]
MGSCGPFSDEKAVNGLIHVTRSADPFKQVNLFPYGWRDSLPAYDDIGDCDQRCRHCGAAFWYEELLKGHSKSARPEYHSCCGGRKIFMHPEEDVAIVKDVIPLKLIETGGCSDDKGCHSTEVDHFSDACSSSGTTFMDTRSLYIV